MPNLQRSVRQTARTIVALATIVVLLTALLAVVVPGTARAAGTLLFQNAFNNRTVDGTGTVTVPVPTSGTNVACLTASGNTTTGPLLSCASPPDSQGSGKLRLTNSTANLVGGIFGSASFPTSNGLDVTFKSYQWGGGSADGMSFVLAAVDPANTIPPAGIGPSGGSLGYSPAGSVRGLPYAYLGVGLDVFGNFSAPGFTGTGCGSPAFFNAQAAGTVAVRGPGNGLVGYCGLSTTWNGVATSKLTLRAATRAASVVPVQVLINPTAAAFTSDSGQSVSAGTYKVIVTPVGQSTKTLTGALPTVPAGLYPSATWTASGVPKQLAFGFIGSTGSVTDVHEISDVKVLTFNPVPQLVVSTTAYSAAAPVAGDPVNYVVTPSVQAGANVTSPISVTQTVPTGVVPVGAYGTGWNCLAPVGRTVTCTTTASSFANGTTLPIVNVVAIVTGTGLTATTIQNTSSTTVSSADANPGADAVMTAGTVPATPSGVTVTPATGLIAGGGVVTVQASTNNVTPTAIEIGTVAEQQAGTSVVLLPCPAGRAAGCFNNEGATLYIQSMPARTSAGAVTITVVTLGVAGTTAYTYTAPPAAPATPTAVAGVNSATVNWVAPAANGSDVTSYLLTPYKNGVAQTAITLDPAATTRLITGLTADVPYRFTIAAVNAIGTSATSSQSTAVTPASPMTAPRSPAASTGTGRATLTWTAPLSNGGGAITGYVITPYIGTTAQTPQTFTGTATTAVVTGLTAGTAYTFTVAATNVISSSVLYRLNTAGPLVSATDGGPEWANDTATSSDYRDDPTLGGTVGTTAALDWTIPTGTPASLFDSERYSAAGMHWHFPVPSGTPVKVRLYFANRYAPTGTVGARVFSVGLDGATVLDSFDIVRGAGGTDIGTMREFATTSDGIVNIDFAAEVENPLINAIEIIQTGVAGSGPAATVATAVTPNAAPAFTAAVPPAGEVGAAYNNQFAIVNGTTPFVWSVSNGAVPAGLTLNTTTGLLSGTPTAAGTFGFTVRIVDASGVTATKVVSLAIAAAPTLTFVPTAGEMTVAYTGQPTLSGGTGPFIWSIAAGSLPAGITLSTSTGALSGTPTVSGTFVVTIRVVDSFAQSVSVTSTINIAALPTLTFPTPAAGQVGVPYSTTLTVSGGLAPITWSVTAGSLPAGLVLNATNGLLSGTPTTVGSSGFTVSVSDTNGKTASKAVTLVVTSGPLVIVKTANTSSTAPAGVVAFTIVITNTSTTAFSGVSITDPLTEVLDDATYNANVTATTGTAAFATPNITWTGNIAANGTVTISYSVTVANPDIGNRVLANTVSSNTLGTNCAATSVDTRCTATVTVVGLNMVKTANVSTTTPGGTVTFSIVVTNTGQTAYAGASLTDSLAGVLDDAVYNANATATSGSVSFTSPNLTWTGNLAVGESATISYTVTVRDPDPGNKSMTGTVVSSTAGSVCPSGNPAASCTATVTVLVPALVIAVNAGAATTTPGAKVNYTLTISNTGQTPYTATSVVLDLVGALDDALYDGNAAASAGSLVYTAGTSSLAWTGNLATGASVTVTGSVTIRDPDPGNKTVTAIASSSAAGSTCPTGSSNQACTSNVQVLVPQLAITNAADVSTTTPGSVVRYTVTVTNTGQTAYVGAAFTDALAGALDDAIYNNDAVATRGSVGFTTPTLSWAGDLAIGATATITYSVTVRQPDNGNRSLTGSVTSVTAGNNCPASSVDPRCQSTVTVLIPGLTISSTTNVPTATPGTIVRYSIAVSNTGQTAYTTIAIDLGFDDVFDDATYNNDASTSVGSIVINGQGKVQWVLSLSPGQSATGSTSFTVTNPPTGNGTMRGSSTSSAPGSSCPTGSTAPACVTSVNVQVPSLLITKTADRVTANPGVIVTYTILVNNNGESTYSAATFTDSLAAVVTNAIYQGDASTLTGTVSYSAPTISWTGSLAPGATATITYSVLTIDPPPGDRQMTNTVVSSAEGNNCPVGGRDSRCTANVTVLLPQLTIIKTANAATTQPGATVGYTVTVTNSGDSPYTSASFADDLGGTLDDATYNGNVSANATVVGSTLNWTGNLVPGAVATITYSVTVKAADVGDDLLTNSITSVTKGSNCAASSTDHRCTVTVPVARLVIEMTSIEATATPGSVVHFVTTYTNTGRVPYVGITTTIDGASGADDSLTNGDQVASSGTLTVSATGAQWTGDIPIDGVVTLTGSTTILSPDLGDKLIEVSTSSAAPGSNCAAGTTDPRCGVSVRVLVPALMVTTSANVGAVVPGGGVQFTVTVQNSGETGYVGASVVVGLVGVLDDAVYIGSTTSAGALSYASPTLTWTGDVAVNGTVTITYSVTARSPDPGDKTMVSTVSSTVQGSSCLPAGGGAGCSATVVVLTPGLTIVKSADRSSTTLGSPVGYTITVTNTGQTVYPVAAFTVSLAGVLDDAVYNGDAGSGGVGSVVYSGGVLSWSGALDPGDVAVISYSVTVRNPASDRSMSSTVTSSTSGNNCVAGSADTRCTAVVSVIDSVALVFTKVADVASTVAGGQVRFTVSVRNASAFSIAEVNFTDALTGVVDDATYNGDAVASAGVVTWTDPDLGWTGTVPAGATVTVSYTVTVKTSLSGDELLTGKVVSTSLPGSNNCVSGSVDARCSRTVPVAALDLWQYADEATVTPGGIVHVTAVYTNTGQVPYFGVSVSSPRADTSDDTVPTGDQTANSGTIVRTATAVTWTGDIPVGGTITLTRTLIVKNPDPGNKLITATVESAAPGNNCQTGTSDPRCTFLTTVLVPALTISKTANTPATVPGGTVGYTITLQNTGQTNFSAATVTDNLVGLLDDAVYNGDAAVTGGGALSFDDSTLVWTGDLVSGATATITYSATTRNPANGDKTMVNSVSSAEVGSTCPAASGNPACRTVVLVLTPALTIEKTADLANGTLGSTVTFTVRVTNSGQTAYPAAAFADSLTDVLDDATFNAASVTATSGASPNYDDVTGVLAWSGALNPGASATITYAVTINNPASGDGNMINRVVSSNTNNNCSSGSTDTRCSVSVAVVNSESLTFTKTANVQSTTAGAVVSYTVQVRNSTGLQIDEVDFTDPLDRVLDDAEFDSNLSADGGSATFSNAVVSWTGTVPAGATITVTYSVTVHTAIAGGDQILTGTVTSTSPPASNNCLSGSTDVRCTSTVPVARLVIEQSYPESTTTPGSLLRLTATFTNTGKLPYYGITIASPSANTIDDAIVTGDQTATSGNLTLSATAISWTGDIPVGGVVTVTGTLTVNAAPTDQNPASGNKIITGTLVSAAPGNNCFSGSIDSRCTALTTVLLPGLSISKFANTEMVSPGEEVEYTILIHNSGETDYGTVSVVESLAGVLDDATYNGDVTATAGDVDFNSPTMSWAGALAKNETVTIVYTVTVRSPDPGDKTLASTVTSGAIGSNCPATGGDAACSNSVGVLTPGLTIATTAGQSSVTLGGVVGYSVSVTNSGQTIYPAAAFAISLAGVLDDAVYDGDAGSGGVGSFDYSDGVLSWSGALVPGDVVVITYSVTVGNPAAGDRSMSSTVTSSTSGNNCVALSADTRCTAVVSVIDSVALVFTKVADVTSVVAGGVVRFTVTATNASAGSVAANFTDPLAGMTDDATFNDDAVTTGAGTTVFATPNLTWSGTIPAGGVVTVSYTVTVFAAVAGLPGDELLTGRVTSTAPVPSNNCVVGNTDTRCIVTVPVAALLIQTSAPSTSTPGSVVGLNATFTNTGQSPYTNITISSPGIDLLDDVTPAGDQTASAGSLSITATDIVWTGDIPAGTTISIISSARVNDPDAGNRLVYSAWSTGAAGSNCPVGGSDATCAVSIVVLLPGLTISTTADTPFTVPGGTVGYTVTIHNTGESAYVGAVVTNSLVGVLDDATYNSDASTTIAAVSYSSSTLTWTGNLAVGATTTITYSVTVHSPATGDKILTNPVSSTTAGSSCLPASGTAACRTTVVVLTPALTITATADTVSSAQGKTVSYTVIATNTGQTLYPAMTFTIDLADVLDDATYDGNAASTITGTGSGSVLVADAVLTWTGSLSPGDVATTTYSVTIENPVVNGNYLLQQAVVSTTAGNNCPVSGNDPRCSSAIPIAGLLIVNSADVTSLRPTDTVHYTTTLTNTGLVPYVDIPVDMIFGDAMDDAEYNGDVLATTGAVEILYQLRTARWTGSVPVNGSVTITFSATVWDQNPDPDPDNHNNDLVTIASTDAPGTNCRPSSTDPQCRTNVPVLNPELTIVQAASTTTSTPGSVIGYTITITNSGESPYTGTTLTDTLDDVQSEAEYQDDADATTGTVDYVAPVLTWTGDLDVDQVVVITFTVRVDNPDLGDKIITNTVVSDELRSTCPTGGTDPRCSTLVTVLVPALDISVTADSTTTVPGATVGYTVTIHNIGQTAYLGAGVTTALSGVLDDASYPGGAVATIGAVSYSSPNLSWSGDLSINATAVITYSVVVADPDTGNHLLSTSVSSVAPGSSCGIAAQCSNAVTVLIPGLSVSTTANVATATPGDQVTFTIAITNTGETAYPAATASTDLTSLLDDATFDGTINASTGVPTFAAGTLAWTGTLSAGESAIIVYAVTIRSPDPGDKILTTTMVADDAGSSCPADSTNPSCTATVTVLVPGLTISQTADVATTTPGSVIHYLITIRNTGQTPYTAVIVTNSFSGVVTDGVYDGNAFVTGGGVVAVVGASATWTGDVAIGATVTITYSVTVNDPDNGDKRIVNSVSSPAPGSTCPPGGSLAACSTSVQVLVPGLTITKAADTSTVIAGSAVGYTITITNTGETAYEPAVVTDSLAGILDDASYGDDATADAGDVELVADSLVWTGSLGVGDTAIVSYSVTTNLPGTSGGVLSNAAVSANRGSSCPIGTEVGCASTVTVLVPSLTITKNANATSVVAGGVIQYTVTATNTGESDYPNAEFSDQLVGIAGQAGVLLGATATSGSVEVADGVLSWHGMLVVGATVVVVYDVEVDVASTGDTTLINVVVSATVGNNCAEGSEDTRCTTVTTILEQTLTLSGLTPSFSLSGPANTTVTANGAMTMTVTTNSAGGYSVSLQAATAALVPATSGNVDSIPIDRLGVRDSGMTLFTAVPPPGGPPLIIHTQGTPTGPNGFAVSNDFQVAIPFVAPDTYSTTLEYIVTAQ